MDVRFKYVIRLLLVLVSLDCAFAVYSEPIYGDVNEDELVDIDDINAVINSILKKGTYAYSDVNCDGATDVDDINHIINIMLHKSGSLAAPTNVKATRNGNAIFVTWDAVANAESYSVYISNDGLNYKFVVGGNTECSCFDSSPLLGKVTYKVKAVSHNAVSEMSEASSIVQYGNTFYSGLFLGVWGFNTRLYQIPISWLDETTISHFTNYINWFQTSNGTALFYAVDNAMSSVAQNSDLQVLNCRYDDDLQHLDLSGCPYLRCLGIEGSNKLTKVFIHTEVRDLTLSTDLKQWQGLGIIRLPAEFMSSFDIIEEPNDYMLLHRSRQEPSQQEE